jgi:hypothetical protein
MIFKQDYDQMSSALFELEQVSGINAQLDPSGPVPTNEILTHRNLIYMAQLPMPTTSDFLRVMRGWVVPSRDGLVLVS